MCLCFGYQAVHALDRAELSELPSRGDGGGGSHTSQAERRPTDACRSNLLVPKEEGRYSSRSPGIDAGDSNSTVLGSATVSRRVASGEVHCRLRVIFAFTGSAGICSALSVHSAAR